jgi:hypothetical protein
MKLPAISLTTLNGYLSAGIYVCLGLLAIPSIPQKYSAVIGGVLVVLRVVSGHLQNDAGSTPALVPGVAGVQQVPSHEIPDNPAAVPVNLVSTSTLPKE